MSSYTTIITTKGQLTIPVKVRRKLGITQGTKLLVKAIDQDRFAVTLYSSGKTNRRFS